MNRGRREEAPDPHVETAQGTELGQRIDRWLWFTRVIKSRTLAAGLVESGRLRLNRQKTVKPSQVVRPGDVLTFTLGSRVLVLKVLRPGTRRGPASEAQTLYQDLSPPPPPRPEFRVRPDAERDAGSGRPTKRDRRLTDKLREDDD